jgi:hypothetical protein
MKNNAQYLDNPNYFGIGSQNYIQVDGMGESKTYSIRRIITSKGIILFKVGQLVSGLSLGNNLVKVKLHGLLQKELGQKFITLHEPKDLFKVESISADGNGTDMGMGGMLGEDISNVTGVISTTPIAPIKTLSSTLVPTAPLSTPIKTVSTTLIDTAVLPPTTAQPISTSPTAGSLLGISIPTATSEVITKPTTLVSTTPVTTPIPAPTTIIAPAIYPYGSLLPPLGYQDAILPYPQTVTPAKSILPSSSAPSGGGGGGGMMGGGMMGGGGGGGAESLASTDEKKPDEASKKSDAKNAPLVINDNKIFGIKPTYFWSAVAIVVAVGGFYAYKQGYLKKIIK